MERGGILVGPGQVMGLSLQGEGQPIRYVHLQRVRKEVRMIGHGTADTVEELRKAIGTRVPLSIVWDGARCVHRIVQRTGNTADVFASAFPNAPMDQLFLSGWVHGATTGASMMRRDQARAQLEALRNAGFRIVRHEVGPWGLLSVRAVQSNTDNDWICCGHAFSFTNEGLATHKVVPASSNLLHLGDDELPSDHALAWSAAWEHLVPSSARVIHDATELALDRAEERARVRYERGMVGLAILLILLLGAERVLHAQVETNGGAGMQGATDRAALRAELEQVESLVASRETLINELGLDKRQPFAERAAKVLDAVPPGILLDRVQVDPLVKALRERERVNTQRGVLRIEGHCTDALVLNQWMEHLKKIAGVRDVRLVAYAADATNAKPSFQLDIDA